MEKNGIKNGINQDEKVIEFTGVSKKFGKESALTDVSFSVARGSIFALLGENGAGKTTSVKILLGLLKPEAGRIRVVGLDPSRNADALAIRRRVGYVPDRPALYDWMTAGEMGSFAASFQRDPKGYWAEFLRLLDSFELKPAMKIKAMSKGMAAQLSLSVALASDPDLLILDEPTGGLDAMVRRRFMESMVERASRGKSVFLASHQITEVERVADHVAIMKKSRLLFDEPLDEMKSRTRTLYLTFDSDIADRTDLRRLVDAFFGTCLDDAADGRTLTVSGRDLCPDALEKLARLGETFGVNLVHHEIVQPSLEEIFVIVEK